MNTSFERTTQKDEWLTPRCIINALGPFDLDPCASRVQPWPTASLCFDVTNDGLLKSWWLGDKWAIVWCNPPYGKQTQHWFRRMAEHNHGIALTFARTETRMFFESVWPKASALLFIRGRLRFCNTKGEQGPNSAGAPSVLIAYGPMAADRLSAAADARIGTIKGKFITL